MIVQKIVRSLAYRLNSFSPNYLGEKHVCPLCSSALSRFEPLSMYYFEELQKHQHIHSIFQMETLNIENYSCPVCGCSDRDRLCYLYILKALKSLEQSEKIRLLELAPAPQLRKVLEQNQQIDYRCADLYMENVDDKVDITDMNIYPDQSFDTFICSHILEHIEDDQKAISELHRILKKDGWGIVMTPIMLGLEENLENLEIKNEGDRWKYYGQDDHVRMYSKTGFINRLENGGFIVEQLGVENFGVEVFEKNGIYPRSILYIVKKG